MGVVIYITYFKEKEIILVLEIIIWFRTVLIYEKKIGPANDVVLLWF